MTKKVIYIIIMFVLGFLTYTILYYNKSMNNFNDILDTSLREKNYDEYIKLRFDYYKKNSIDVIREDEVVITIYNTLIASNEKNDSNEIKYYNLYILFFDILDENNNNGTIKISFDYLNDNNENKSYSSEFNYKEYFFSVVYKLFEEEVDNNSKNPININKITNYNVIYTKKIDDVEKQIFNINYDFDEKYDFNTIIFNDQLSSYEKGYLDNEFTEKISPSIWFSLLYTFVFVLITLGLYFYFFRDKTRKFGIKKDINFKTNNNNQQNNSKDKQIESIKKDNKKESDIENNQIN